MTTTVITGANKGLGYETARLLVAEGHTVYVGARVEENARKAAEMLGARPLLIDITDDESVAAAAATVAAEAGHIDILINNAGIAGPTKQAADITAADITAVLDTNVVGIVRVTTAFRPLLADGGVIVNVGSGLGSFDRVHDTNRIESTVPALAYCAAKTAVSMMTVHYARAYPELRVNVVDPGYTATDLNGFRGTQTVAEGAEPIVRAALLPSDGPTGVFLDADGVVPW